MKKFLLSFLLIGLHALIGTSQNCALNCPKNLNTSLHPEAGCTSTLTPYDLMINPTPISPSCQAYQLKLDYPLGTHQLNGVALDLSHSGYSMTYHIIDSVSKNSCWGTLKVNYCNLCQIPTPPVITMFTESAGPYIPGDSVTLTVTATDNVSIAKVEFYNGTTLINTDYGSPYIFKYRFSPEYATKNYFYAIVYDNCGDRDTSAEIIIKTLFPTCYDGFKNGSETGIDCGGGCHEICPVPCYKPEWLSASVSGSYVTLSWSGSASKYDLEIFNIGTNTLAVTTPLATNPYQINLVDGNYRYRVRLSTCPWSDYKTFSVNTSYGHCYVPANLSHTVNGSQVSLSWTGYASQYHLEIINTSTNTTVVSSIISTTNYQTSLPNGYYIWRVKSVCGNQYSDWCTDQAFSIHYSDPHCYTPGNPSAAVFGDKVTLTWTGSSSYYHLEIVNTSTWATVVSTTWATSPYMATLPNGNYKARLRSVCGSSYSYWTSEVFFTINVMAQPPCHTPYHMLFSIMGNYVTIVWSGEADQYQMELENTDNNVMVYNGTTASSSYQSSFNPGNYRCRVRSKCPPYWSEWCDYGWFTIQGSPTSPPPSTPPPAGCAIPTQLFNSVALQNVTLTWSGVTDQYQIQAENRVTGEAVISAGINTKSYQATLPNGGYKYRVRSQCGAEYSAWSTWSEFTINVANPIVITPDPDTCTKVPSKLTVKAVGSSVTFSWSGGSAQYLIQVKHIGADTSLFENTLLLNSYSTTLTAGTYEFKVKGICGMHQTSWSKTAKLIVGGAEGKAIDLFDPVVQNCNNTVAPRILQATKTSVTLGWNKGSGQANYTIEIYDGLNPELLRYITTAYTDTSITFTGLLPDKVYKIFIKTDCGTGLSGFTSHTVFTTPASNNTSTSKFDCDDPKGLAVNFISSTSALVSWGPVTGLKYYKLIVESTGSAPDFSLLKTVLSNQYTVVDLLPGGTYQFRVGAECFFSKSIYTPNMAFVMPGTSAPAQSLESRSISNHPMTVDIYPNPVRSTLNIRLHDIVDREGQLELSNINGQVQASWQKIQLRETMSLNVDHLAAGVYVLRLRTGHSQTVKKILVE